MPLLHVLAIEAGSEDMFFTLDYSLGVTSLGRALPSFVMPLKITKPLLTVEDLRAQAPARTALLLQSVRSSGDADLDEESLKKTQAEIDSGIMLGPWRASRLPKALRVVSRRFPIWENHGASGQRKCRNLDDMSESNINPTVEDYETYVPKGVECILALIVLLRSLFGGDINMLGWTADFKAAYRQVACNPKEYCDLGIAYWDCHANCVMVGTLTALAFGSRRAVVNWGRVIMLLMTIGWHHFCLLILDYVDDVNSIEPAFSAESGRETWVFLIELLGLKLDPSKCSPRATDTFDSLGVSWTLAPFAGGLVEILRRLADNLKDDIRDILSRNVLYPSHAARLRGKLAFAGVAAFGRFGRAQLSALKRRQYKHSASLLPNYALTTQLSATLSWWLVRLDSLPPRSVPPSPSSKHLVAYSDGEGTGGLAACLTFQNGSTEYCCTTVPQAILTRWSGKQNIHRIEALGPLLMLLTWPNSLRGKLLGFFIDNKAALGSMVGGWSNEDVINDITALTWQIAAQMHLYVYFEWVESKANIIDAASRVKSDSDHLVYQSRGWTRVDPVTPWSFLLPDDPVTCA